ncbi:MAG: hypothetical protein WA624_10445, partial [Methylocella sp.]
MRSGWRSGPRQKPAWATTASRRPLPSLRQPFAARPPRREDEKRRRGAKVGHNLLLLLLLLLLFLRLATRKDTLRFLRDAAVPIANNQAERGG